MLLTPSFYMVGEQSCCMDPVGIVSVFGVVALAAIAGVAVSLGVLHNRNSTVAIPAERLVEVFERHLEDRSPPVAVVPHLGLRMVSHHDGREITLYHGDIEDFSVDTLHLRSTPSGPVYTGMIARRETLEALKRLFPSSLEVS